MKGFLYDLHTHTAEVSSCGRLPAAEVIDRYAAAGFAGIAVTDHLHQGFLDRLGPGCSWDEAVDRYLAGYRASKRQGEKAGVRVVLGAELRFPENDNDYLIYGIDEAWLRKNPGICRMTAQGFFDRYHDEVLIIEAHPFREGSAPVQEGAVHGVELVNSNPRHDNGNEQALALCRRHPEYLRTAGSDTHREGDAAQVGVIFSEPAEDSFACRRMLLAGQFTLWAPAYEAFVQADGVLRAAQPQVAQPQASQPQAAQQC